MRPLKFRHTVPTLRVFLLIQSALFVWAYLSRTLYFLRSASGWYHANVLYPTECNGYEPESGGPFCLLKSQSKGDRYIRNSTAIAFTESVRAVGNTCSNYSQEIQLFHATKWRFCQLTSTLVRSRNAVNTITVL